MSIMSTQPNVILIAWFEMNFTNGIWFSIGPFGVLLTFPYWNTASVLVDLSIFDSCIRIQFIIS